MEMAKPDTTKTCFFHAIRLEDQYCGDRHRTKNRRMMFLSMLTTSGITKND